MTGIPYYPFEPDRRMGSVVEVYPSKVVAIVSTAASRYSSFRYGSKFPGGEVGEFVFVEAVDSAVFGRITEVKIPYSERQSIDSNTDAELRSIHPACEIQVLSAVDLASGRVSNGVSVLPRVGAAVYSAHPQLVKWMAEAGYRRADSVHLPLNIFRIPSADNVALAVGTEELFCRHIAVLGATGSGKSWTLARIMEETRKYKSKMILLDASGEFYRQTGNVRHVHLGAEDDKAPGCTRAIFPHHYLTENDLFAIMRPSGQSQAPKLRAAMKSLKLARINAALATDGLILKANRSRTVYETAYRQNIRTIDSPFATFDVMLLARQVEAECVWPTDMNHPDRWGNINQNELSYCVTLVNRIEDTVNNAALSVIFGEAAGQSLTEVIDEFVIGTDRLLRISLQHVAFESNAREIVANAIGRYLLRKARDGVFKGHSPCVIVVDEAHQFLDKRLGGEEHQYVLDAFGLIAKEGRKYWLSICLATQRPRDIPTDVISQVGAMIVHRLINPHDRDLVERSAGEIDRAAAGQLPMLDQGEAIVIGADLPFSVRARVEAPTYKPDSSGAPYSEAWRIT